MDSPNIVLLCLDSVRADVFSEEAAGIQKRANRSYSGCRAASSWSVPSHASIFSGRLPSEHGVHAHNRRMDSFDPVLINQLPDEYNSVGLSANLFAGPSFNFDVHFDDFVDIPRYQLFLDGLNATEFFHNSESSGVKIYTDYLKETIQHEHPVKSLINGFTAQVKKSTMGTRVPDPLDDGANSIRRRLPEIISKSKGPTFAFANLMEAHVPFSVFRGLDQSQISVSNSWSSQNEDYWDVVNDPDQYDQYLQNMRELYAANVSYLDSVISSLIDDVCENVDRETIFIITGDHGENLGYRADEQLIGHKSSLSESLLHVPLEIVNAPKEGNISDYVSHLKIHKLIQNLSQNQLPNSMVVEGTPSEILGMSAGPEPTSDVQYWDRAQRAVYLEEKKYVLDSLGNCSVYELDNEKPCWQSNGVSVDPPALFSKVFADDIDRAKSNAMSGKGAVNVAEATQGRLEDLGYL